MYIIMSLVLYFDLLLFLFPYSISSLIVFSFLSQLQFLS